MYGLSEAGPRVASQRKGCRGTSVGYAIKGVDIAIVDNQGNILSTNEYGIIHVHTLSRFSGYISGFEKQVSLYKGWLNTGDVGYWDENGELHIVDRIDDVMIIDSHKSIQVKWKNKY
ncbi:MAG: long-chain fatty acid--CoA ligase [Lachnospiraceae bacterium]|nr:long-chain fatty acid--CoA ligase [Lachnospiraceae bacterium]